MERTMQFPCGFSIYASIFILLQFTICGGVASAGAVRELLIEPGPAATGGECVDPYCRQYGDLRLHIKPQRCTRPPVPPSPPRPPLRPSMPSPPPDLPGFGSAPVAAYCGVWRVLSSGDTCASIVKLFGLPSVDFLQRINPTLNCTAPQVGLNLCVNKFSQWAIPNCLRFVSLWDGDSCQSVINANAATLPYGLDDLYACNGGLNCNYLLRGMIVCVSCL